jgi:hypothetical protein
VLQSKHPTLKLFTKTAPELAKTEKLTMTAPPDFFGLIKKTINTNQ